METKSFDPANYGSKRYVEETVQFSNIAMERLISDAAAFVRNQLPEQLQRPAVGVICGTGLSNLGSRLTDVVTIPFSSIPNFPATSVAGHGTNLLAGLMNGIPALILTGRIHFYEGHALHTIVIPVRILIALGIHSLLTTNAAGGLDESFRAGDIMVFSDHISFLSLSGLNPLRGPNLDSFGPRFPSITSAYVPNAHELVSESAESSGLPASGIRKGVYVMVGGPSYESPAEVRFLRMIGGSAVGMSTVPEVICAAHANVNIVGMSLITNVAFSQTVSAADRESGAHEPNHAEVLEAARLRGKDMEILVYNLIPKLASLPKKHAA
jgi:purine-nucleoside phosphorylase